MSDNEPPDRGRPLSNSMDEGSPISDPINESLFLSSQMDPEFSNRKRTAEETFSSPKKNKNPGDSYQNIYVSPGYNDDDPQLNYSDSDIGPFLVHICRVEPDLTSGLSLQVLKVAQLLHKNNVQDIVEGSIKSIGRNKISVGFKNAQVANNFYKMEFLSQNKLLASIPRYHVSRMGVIKNIPTDWTLEELVEGLQLPSGLGSQSYGNVIKARRLSRKIRRAGQPPEWIPSNTVVLTFHSQSLPERIYIYNTSIPVSTYELPSIQCRKCCKFGHIAAKCRSKPICYNCAQPHPGESCSISEDRVSCVLCLGRHKATDQICPEHGRQKAIKSVMSQENIGYIEASQRFRPARMSYSHASQKGSPRPPSPQRSSTPSPIPNYTTEPIKQTSYKRTIIVNQKSKPQHSKNKMYDVHAHRQIVSDPPPSLPNGCALRNDHSDTPNDNFLDHLTGLLVNLIHKFSDSLPNNVITQLQSIVPLIVNNGSEDPTVESTEYN